MNNKRLAPERTRDIGKFLVGRLLPFAKKRQVGPFTFIDHMGPAVIGPPNYMDIDQHPHIGLSTLTYLLSGEVHHRDSTGASQIIKAGDVGFMTSGKGVAHSERTPEALRNGNTFEMHGYQIWVAMPKELEESEPDFQFISKEDIPSCKQDGLDIKLIAGSGFGMTSPLEVLSPLFMVDIYSEKDNKIDIAGQLEGEIAIVVVHGKVNDNDTVVEAGTMLISKTENECYLNIRAGSRVLLFGGEPLPEERFLHWNFVSSNKERLKQAADDWKNKLFPKIPGDNSYIPLPE